MPSLPSHCVAPPTCFCPSLLMTVRSLEFWLGLMATQIPVLGVFRIGFHILALQRLLMLEKFFFPFTFKISCLEVSQMHKFSVVHTVTH